MRALRWIWPRIFTLAYRARSTWLTTGYGQRRYTRDGFNTIWTRAQAALPKERRFSFHDLKRKGTTDYDGRKENFTGHTTDRMAESYNVKPIKSPSLGD